MRERRLGPVRRAALTLAVFLLVLASGVVAVTSFLEWRPLTATQRCNATLPDGGAHLLDAEQADVAALVAAVAGQRGLPARAVTIALATGLQESKLENIDYGDRDSVGIFQQRPSQGWGTVEQLLDPVYATNAFYDALVLVDGYEEMAITVSAQAVQRSAYPEAYAKHETRARAFASALSGYSQGTLTCDLDPLDDAPAALPSILQARLTRDWGAAPVTATDDGVVVDATALVDGVDAATAAWSVGHWAVATALDTGAGAVVVGDRMWQRGEDGWGAADVAQPEGLVLIR